MLRRTVLLNADRKWTLLVEAMAIVASILLAFAIDAWWDARSDRSAERAALDRLLTEYDQNLALLAVDKNVHQKALTATGQLLAMVGPNRRFRGDTAEIGKILVACLTNPTFNPRLGATNSLIASGDLRLIGDAHLQAMLSQWPGSAGDLLEWQEIERNHGEELILNLTYDFVAWPDVDFALGLSERPSAFDSNFSALLTSRRFEGLLNNRRWNLRNIMRGIGKLEADTIQLIERLKARRSLL